MARFDTSGLDDLFLEMEREAELVGEIADEMLLAGAEIVKQEWKKSAERHGHRDTGALIESIGYPIKPKTAKDIRKIDIYPQGKDAKGTRNAEKAFILNYGTPRKGKPGSHWVDDADAASAEPVEKAFKEIWENR